MNNEKKKESFVLYTSFFKPISGLSNEQLGRLFRAIFEWQISGINEVDTDISMAFEFFVNQFRIDTQKYNSKCERMAINANKRWSMQLHPIASNCIQTYANNADNDNENENENDNDNENESIKRASSIKLSFPFSSPEFLETWNELRQQPKWRTKTTTALQKSLNKLKPYSEDFAIELMNTAIANGNQGLVYENTPRLYNTWLENHPRETKRVITSIDGIW